MYILYEVLLSGEAFLFLVILPIKLRGLPIFTYFSSIDDLLLLKIKIPQNTSELLLGVGTLYNLIPKKHNLYT